MLQKLKPKAKIAFIVGLIIAFGLFFRVGLDKFFMKNPTEQLLHLLMLRTKRTDLSKPLRKIFSITNSIKRSKIIRKPSRYLRGEKTLNAPLERMSQLAIFTSFLVIQRKQKRPTYLQLSTSKNYRIKLAKAER